MAAQLQSTTLRLQSISPSQTSTPIYVQTTIPSGTLATEDQVRVTVPSGWTVAGVPGVSVGSLPAGVTAWPGISYSGTSGQILSFSSDDVVPGTTYGFYITSGVGANPSSAEEAQWLLETYSGGSLVDTAQVGISILPNTGSIAISGEVQADASAFTVSLDRTAPLATTITAGDTVSYQITYNHTLQYSSSMTFVASWSSDTPVLEYVVGSATTAYGGTAPVIDTVNNTITWTTSSMPSGTADQTVSFSLQAGTVVSETAMPVTIQAQVTAPTAGAAVSEQLSYQYEPPAAPTPTPTASSTSGSGSTSTTDTSSGSSDTSSSSPQTNSGVVTSVRVLAVNSTSAHIQVLLDGVRAVRLMYQTESGEIKSVSGAGKQSYVFELEELLPNSTYTFWIVDAQTGDRLTSETFSFTTTKVVTSVVELIQSGIIAYEGVWLQEWQPQQNQIVVSQVRFDVDFSLSPSAPVLKNVWLELEPEEGFTLRYPLGHSAIERLHTQLWFEQSQEFVRARVHARTVDGMLLTQQLGAVTVVPPLQIVSSATGAPLPHAELKIEVRNPQSNTFQTLALSEVVRTSNQDGVVPLLLAPGRYRIAISLPGFYTKEVELDWPNSAQHQIGLDPWHDGLFGWIYQIPIVIKKTAAALIDQVIPLLQNESIVKAAELGTGVLAAFVAVLLLATYGNIPLHILPSYIWKAAQSGTLFRKGAVGSQPVVFRDIRTGEVLSGVDVQVFDEAQNSIKLRSSRYGKIILSGLGVKELRIQKMGYNDLTSLVVQEGNQTEILLTPEDDRWHTGLHLMKRITRVVVGYSIEVLLGLIVLFELGLLFAVGWQALPLFLTSVAASIIWFYYHIVVHHHLEIE